MVVVEVAVAKCVASVVEDDGVLFAFHWAQCSACHLSPSGYRTCGSGDGYGAYAWDVQAFDTDIYVNELLYAAGVEVSDDAVSFLGWRISIQILGVDAFEHVFEMEFSGVFSSCGER